MASLFLSAVIFGITFCAVPGMVTTEVLRRGLRGGFRPALRFQLGAVIGAEIVATAGLLGNAAVARSSKLQLTLGLLGAMFLARLVWGTFQDVCTPRPPSLALSTTRPDVLAGIGMSLLNPFALTFWLSAGSGLLPRDATGAAVVGHSTVLLAGILVGSLFYRVLFAGLIAWGRRFITATSIRWVNGVCGIILSYYGLRLLAHTASMV